jgi:predicted Ser/Thr protein kinase
MLLMSWGGEEIDDSQKYRADIKWIVREIQKEGIEQDDVRLANILRNGKRVMLIDFERAKYTSVGVESST